MSRPSNTLKSSDTVLMEGFHCPELTLPPLTHTRISSFPGPPEVRGSIFKYRSLDTQAGIKCSLSSHCPHLQLPLECRIYWQEPRQIFPHIHELDLSGVAFCNAEGSHILLWLTGTLVTTIGPFVGGFCLLESPSPAHCGISCRLMASHPPPLFLSTPSALGIFFLIIMIFT